MRQLAEDVQDGKIRVRGAEQAEGKGHGAPYTLLAWE
jgi:hypothetical protein